MNDAIPDVLPFDTVLHIRDACMCLAAQRAACGITPEGVALMRQAVDVWRAEHAALESDMDDDLPETLKAGSGADHMIRRRRSC